MISSQGHQFACSVLVELLFLATQDIGQLRTLLSAPALLMHPLSISLLCILLRAAHSRLCVLVEPLYSHQISRFSSSLQRK